MGNGELGKKDVHNSYPFSRVTELVEVLPGH
jgi:hypothetical protein